MTRDTTNGNCLDRRTFLQGAGLLGLGAALGEQMLALRAADAEIHDVKGADLKTPSGKPLRGLYPIMETPFTAADKLDTAALAAEVAFLNRGRVAGMIWPVFASSWSALSDAERIEGAETILAAGKGGKSAMAIAVQNMAWDIPTSVRYAKHAAAHGADAGGARLLQDHRRSHRPAADRADARHHERGPDDPDVSTDPQYEGDQGRGWRYAGARDPTDPAY